MMTDYIVLLDPGTRHASLILNDHGFPEVYATWDDANKAGALYLFRGDCKDYAVFKYVNNSEE